MTDTPIKVVQENQINFIPSQLFKDLLHNLKLILTHMCIIIFNLQGLHAINIFFFNNYTPANTPTQELNSVYLF